MPVNMKNRKNRKHLTRPCYYSIVKYMKKRSLIIILILIIIGLLVGIYWDNINVKMISTQVAPTTPNQPANTNVETSPLPTLTLVPSPTWPPFQMKITIISDVFINIANEQRSDRISISKTKAFKRINGKLIPIDISELKVGQAVTVDVKSAGNEIHLIIEQ